MSYHWHLLSLYHHSDIPARPLTLLDTLLYKGRLKPSLEDGTRRDTPRKRRPLETMENVPPSLLSRWFPRRPGSVVPTFTHILLISQRDGTDPIDLGVQYGRIHERPRIRAIGDRPGDGEQGPRFLREVWVLTPAQRERGTGQGTVCRRV